MIPNTRGGMACMKWRSNWPIDAARNATRVGTPAMTTQGMTEVEATETARLIVAALRAHDDEDALTKLAGEIGVLASKFQPYPSDWAGHLA